MEPVSRAGKVVTHASLWGLDRRFESSSGDEGLRVLSELASSAWFRQFAPSVQLGFALTVHLYPVVPHSHSERLRSMYLAYS